MNFQQFQEEYKKLKLSFPRRMSHNHECENSDYGDYLARCKNAYFSFETADAQNIIYVFDSVKAVNCCDGDYIIESQNCYDCVDTVNANNCTYMNYCSRIYDSHFCWDCNDSHDLFGCVHLQHKDYCIFNRQYTQEEYVKKIAELKKRPAEENLKEMKKIAQLFPATTTLVSHVENCDYNNQVFHSKNMYLCFDSAYSEDSAYLYDSHQNKSCFDMTQTHYCEFSYECVDGYHLNNCFNINYSAFLYDSAFCEECDNSNHLFGCISLSNKEYCILNRQYTKEEYEKQVKEIMESMKS